jgi:hypothetical protein
MALPLFGKAHEASPGRDFTWFVYGSSLDADAFASWAREHGYVPPPLEGARRARLDGFRLAFDVASRGWGGAVASLAESTGEYVEGLAVPMPGAARGLVEHKEGAVSGLYTAIDVSLTALDTGEVIPAVAFRGARSRRLAADAPPAPEYLAVLVRGARARGLSAEWVSKLEALGARP